MQPKSASFFRILRSHYAVPSILLFSIVALGQQQSTQDTFLGIATFPLWVGTAPGSAGNGSDDTPTLTIFRPHAGTANGTAVIIAPGGAYVGLAGNLEGRQVADWFAARGVTAFVLKYRLGKKYLYPIPLTDARRAVRLVRSRAKEFGISPSRIGMMGFSAGGHLTAAASTMFDEEQSTSNDAVDKLSSRPDFVILGYPWLNAMTPDQNGISPYCMVLRVDAGGCKDFPQYSPESHVTKQTPPTFIYHTTDDELVPVDVSVTFYRALRGNDVPAEMHIFAHGKHGSGLGLGDPALDLWPSLLEAWLRGRGLLTPDLQVLADAEKNKAPPTPRKPGQRFSVDLAVGELLDNPEAKSILVKTLGNDFVKGIPESARSSSLRQVAQFIPDVLTPAKLQALDIELAKVPVP